MPFEVQMTAAHELSVWGLRIDPHLYLMLELHSGLPWSNVSFDEMLSKKSDIVAFLGVPEYIRVFISLTRACRYDVEPDYGQFREVLTIEESICTAFSTKSNPPDTKHPKTEFLLIP